MIFDDRCFVKISISYFRCRVIDLIRFDSFSSLLLHLYTSKYCSCLRCLMKDDPCVIAAPIIKMDFHIVKMYKDKVSTKMLIFFFYQCVR